MSGTHWLSQGAEDFLAAYSVDLQMIDVVIVGSGYGGAVAAARLAGLQRQGRPLDVVVIERGKEYLPGEFPQRFADLPGHVRFNSHDDPEPKGMRQGLFDLRTGPEVAALMGNGLGGGSLINAGVMAEPTAEVFDERWPAALRTGAALAPYYQRVRNMLGVRKLPLPSGEERSPYAKPAKLAALELVGTLLDGRDLDRRAEVAVSFSAGESVSGVRQQACIQCGDCFTGCNHWAKNTLAMNYLPQARRRGARLVTGLTVLKLRGRDEDWQLEVTLTDRSMASKYMDKSVLPPVFRDRLRIRARHVILAAGTYGSTEILLRSSPQGGVSAQLGERFSTNGDMIAAGYGVRPLVNGCATEAQSPASRNVGPTIAGILDLRHGRPLHQQIAIEEMAAPAALRRLLEETVTNVDALHALTRGDRSRHEATDIRGDPAAINSAAVERTLLYAVMGHDAATGRLQRVGEQDLMSDGALTATRGSTTAAIAEHPVFQFGIEQLRKAHADSRLGGVLLPNPLWDPWPKELTTLFDRTPRKGAAITVHPLGGCAMADNVGGGVVNHRGQVFRADGQVHDTLAVLDGSIVPTALGINPALTIAALAERAVEELIVQWNLEHVPASQTAPLSAPPSIEPIATRSPRPTGFRFSEKLDGTGLRLPVGIAGSPVPYEWTEARDASLRLVFTPVPDMMALLATHPKILTADTAELTLNGGAEPLRVPVTGYMSLLERGNSTRLCRTVRALWAWLLMRGMREIWSGMVAFFGGETTPPGRAPASLWQRIRQLVTMASIAGERRHYRYELTVTRDVGVDQARYFGAGDRLIGLKTIAYRWRGNLWRQWTDMELYLQRQGCTRRQHLGMMSVDLPYYVSQHAVQMQLTEQDSQPQAIADFISFATYTARVFGRIHVWSFQAPDYPAELRDSHAGTQRWALRERFNRVPGEVAGATREQIDTTGQAYKLYRYRPSNGNTIARPVLLIHGLGAGGNSFTLDSVEQSLAAHLISAGYEAWVVELRTSIALRSSGEEWSFEEVARQDVAGALSQVHELSGGQAVSVVAHCLGAAMFCMAALEGLVKPEWIRSAVLSQLGPLVELTPLNRFRGHAAAFLKYLLRMREFDVTTPRNDVMDVVDRILSSYPYSKNEWFHHHPIAPWRRVQHAVYCDRASMIYNPLFEHDNVNQATLDRFGDFVGHMNLRTYIQTLYFASQRRLTDNLGRNVFVTEANVAKHLRFPICFVHGEKNQLFHADTSRRSYALLSSVFRDADPKRPAHRIEIVPGYGHQDCIIGARAHRDVFPRITQFFRDTPEAASTPRHTRIVVHVPRLGPLLGWARRDADGKRHVSVTFVPDEELSEALAAITLVCARGDLAEVLPGGIARHALQRVRPSRPSAPPPCKVDVELPDGDSFYIAVATLHAERTMPSADCAADLPAAILQTDELAPFAVTLMQAVRAQTRPNGSRASDARMVDARYAYTPGCAQLSSDVTRAIGGGEAPFTFAAGSCRYAPSGLDRELADRSFGRLRARLDGDGPGRRPQMLLLTGDQIYADATAGLFDPTSALDRYDNQYLEAWSAPNARHVMARLPTYMMLDDHEIRDNWEAGATDPDLRDALPAFHAYALLGMPPNPSGPRSRSTRPFRHWYEFVSGGRDFFVLDTRTERRHNLSGAHGIHDDLLGEAQWTDLEYWLGRCDRQRLKFIVSPSVVAPWSKVSQGSAASALRADAWDGSPHSLNRLLRLIAATGQHRIAFVSGDYHCSLVCDMRWTHAGHTVQAVSIVSSGLYAPYPMINGTPAEFALEFDGSQIHWVRSVGRVRAPADPIDIRYRTRRDSFVTCNSVAVVSVDSSEDLEIEFLAEDGVTRTRWQANF